LVLSRNKVAVGEPVAEKNKNKFEEEGYRIEKRELSREEGTRRKTPARLRRGTQRTKREVGRRH
jgi:hypothetical protein